MRHRQSFTAAAAVVLAVGLGGCGGDPKTSPSAPMTEVTIDCHRYADAAQRITDAQAALYGGDGGSKAVDSLLTELDALASGAPADVRAAITELGDAFRKAQQVLAQPSSGDAASLADLGPRLSEDGRTITRYVVSRCH